MILIHVLHPSPTRGAGVAGSERLSGRGADRAAARLWFSSYLQTYLERDVRAVTAVKDLTLFRWFLALLDSRHGQVLNKTDLAAPLGVSVPTIAQWLGVLETTTQIMIVPPFFENLRKRLIKSPKIYAADSGLACHLLGIDTVGELTRSPFRGAPFEGFIAAEMVKAQVNEGGQRELYYFATSRVWKWISSCPDAPVRWRWWNATVDRRAETNTRNGCRHEDVPRPSITAGRNTDRGCRPWRVGAAVAWISRRVVTTKQSYQAPKGHNDEEYTHTSPHGHRASVCAGDDHNHRPRYRPLDCDRGRPASVLERRTSKAIHRRIRREGDERGLTLCPAAERVAVFDNDGTLWAEQPIYFQLAFALDRVKALAPQHPEWKTKEPFASLLKGNVKGALAGGELAIFQIVMATHAGMTTEEFEKILTEWITTAKHPVTKCLYTDLAYQPMLELLTYLRTNGFKTFIVSGGGVEFMRAFAEKVYGIPPDQVVGSSGKQKFELRAGKFVLVKLPALDFFDDKDGKPIAIQKFIGRRPTAAFGNSDGDLQMLQWTCDGSGARLCLYVHHTDAEREWAYDRKSSIGRLDKGLDEAQAKGWTVVDMKKDWNRIFPFENK